MIYQPIHSILYNQLIKPNTIKYLFLLLPSVTVYDQALLSPTENCRKSSSLTWFMRIQLLKPWKSSIYFHCTLDNAIPREYVINVLYVRMHWVKRNWQKNIPGVKWRTLRLVSVCVVFGFLYARSIIFSGRSDDKRRKFFSINVAVDIAEWLVVQFSYR